MLDLDLKALPVTKPIRLRNVICPYCGSPLIRDNTTKEHVIGRKFVPKRTLENHWNLILNACRACNNRKSDLEDDIAAITMQPDVSGRPFGTHAQLALDAAHKRTRTLSRHTKKPVGQSQPTMEIKYGLGPGMTLTFNMIGQAEIADERAFELAMRHFQGFFYFITYDHNANRGWWWKGVYAPLQAVSKNDWGNDVARTFMKQTEAWDQRLLGITAAEHFKVAIRKNLMNDVWSPAVEWNESYRIFALCGDEEHVRAMLANMPKMTLQTIYQHADSGLAVRTEQSLKEVDDTMFVPAPISSPTEATAA